MLNRLFRAADGLVLIWVCKNATWSIVIGRFVDASGPAAVYAWYGLALAYLGMAVLASVNLPAWACLAARTLSMAGVGGCVALALVLHKFASPSAQVAWYDWLVLAGCFALGALRPCSTKKPAERL
jgi:hypothetical protein